MSYRTLIGKCLSVLALLATLSLSSSCQKEGRLKPLNELKSEQADAIKQLIAKRNLRVQEIKEVKSFPANPDPAVYYKMPNGVYICVKHPGDMNRRAVENKTRVSLYFKGHYFNKDIVEGATFNNLSYAGLPPVEFLYTSYYSFGEVHFSLLPQQGYYATLERMMCEGLAYPMSLLGDGARVSLIIPFEAGPADTYTQGVSVFIEEARYIFSK